MNKLQKFALEKIYCAPGQDQQFSFSLVRVNKVGQPLTVSVDVYNVKKRLPNLNYKYHVFVLGNINPQVLNLLRQGKDWYRDVWVKVSDDMVLRNYLFKLYNDKGVVYPRDHVYYSYIDENSLIIALEFEYSIKQNFDVDSFKYVHLYSNSFFNSVEYLDYPVRNGIKHDIIFVTNNVDKVTLQNKIASWELSGGKAIVYVNGYYTDNLNLNIPDNSYVEVVYDQSIISKEKFKISELRTFDSVKDDKLKYLIFRNNTTNSIQFKDDVEIYISNSDQLVTKGLFFYQHKDYVVRNVTDKDFSLYSSYVNNTAQNVTNITTGSIADKEVILYTRKAGVTRDLIYSSPKLHELYKLPQDVELDVMTNNNFSLSDFRASTLEDSDYFKVANLSNVKNLTSELAMSAVGYNGTTYYFGNTPVVLAYGVRNVNVPYLYQEKSLAFEYDASGKFIGWYTTTGPVYITNNLNVRYVEFLYGQNPSDFGRLYSAGESVTLLHNEYRVLSAYFDNITRITKWMDITNDDTKYTVSNNILSLSNIDNNKVKIVYLNQPNVYDISLPLVDNVLYFPLTCVEDKGTGLVKFPLDVPYTNIELYLNGHKLIQGLDYFMKFPYVSICSKEYIDYTSPSQSVHVRMYGFTLNKDDINSTEKVGFVNHGVLSRNNNYDIRDDRVISVYIKGLIQNRSSITYAENDNTVRISNPLNGLPYVIKEPFIPLKSITSLDTINVLKINEEKNKRISDLFNIIYPEPTINETNVIWNHYYVFSPTISKIISDLIDGNISSSLYMSPYNDEVIINLLGQYPYKDLLELDPIKNNMPDNLVEIHPTSLNTVTNINIYQYRFISRVIYLLTNGDINKINISGYLSVTT